jgi:hypothetical protein
LATDDQETDCTKDHTDIEIGVTFVCNVIENNLYLPIRVGTHRANLSIRELQQHKMPLSELHVISIYV